MTSDMLNAQEEIFGPLLGLYKFETENEVVEFANDTAKLWVLLRSSSPTT